MRHIAQSRSASFPQTGRIQNPSTLPIPVVPAARVAQASSEGNIGLTLLNIFIGAVKNTPGAIVGAGNSVLSGLATLRSLYNQQRFPRQDFNDFFRKYGLDVSQMSNKQAMELASAWSDKDNMSRFNRATQKLAGSNQTFDQAAQTTLPEGVLALAREKNIRVTRLRVKSEESQPPSTPINPKLWRPGQDDPNRECRLDVSSSHIKWVSPSYFPNPERHTGGSFNVVTTGAVASALNGNKIASNASVDLTVNLYSSGKNKEEVDYRSPSNFRGHSDKGQAVVLGQTDVYISKATAKKYSPAISEASITVVANAKCDFHDGSPPIEAASSFNIGPLKLLDGP